MPSFLRTFSFGDAFFIIKFAIILAFLNGTKTQSQTQIPQISTSVGKYICDQQKVHQETGEIQSPLQARPQNDDSKCGWYIWSKCADSNSESDSCPSFDLKMCDEAENPEATKKGKGIAKQQKQQPPKNPCTNSTEKGLPNPEIVSSMSKFPSVVTIEKGDICQVRLCTGLILDKNWVIVQHTECFKEYSEYHPDLFVVVAGERRVHVDEGTEQRRNVAAYIPHPDTGMKKLQYNKNDIGLVRVSTPFEFNENVQPIDLAAIETVAPSIPKSSIKIVGWIKAQPMKEEEELLASLMESPLDFAPIDDCFDKIEGEAPGDSLICAGKCLVSGDEKNQPGRSILYAQQNSESESESVWIPVGLGPLRILGAKLQYGAFLNLAPFIPWIKETVEDQGQGQSESPESEPESRIIRGEDAPPYKYKSMVNLEIYNSYACTVHICGGSILSEEWVVTAAHCLSEFEFPERYRIIASDHDVSENNDNEQIRVVSKIIIHENNTVGGSYYDIGLVKVTPPFIFNDRVQKVTLPEPSFEPTPGEALTAIGWGKNEYLQFPHVLQQVQIPFVTLDECQKSYDAGRYTLKETQMCAGNSTHGVYQGDSGSPLFFVSEAGEQIILGIASSAGVQSVGGENGENCESSSYASDSKACVQGQEREKPPQIFVKVSYFIEWIMKNAEMSAK